MKHPDPWQLIMLVLAVWRFYRILAVDEITEKPRGWLTMPDDVYDAWSDLIEEQQADGIDPWLEDHAPPFSQRRYYWSRFWRCPWCMGWWLSLIAWALWLAWPAGTLLAATPFALSAGVGIVQTLMSEDTDVQLWEEAPDVPPAAAHPRGDASQGRGG